ncbi:cation:proton antiporter domain-containing protein [Endozoicomonadaceae bacterium StTr2]
MLFENLILEMAIIMGGASVLGALFVWLKQPIILAYIALGLVAGPFGTGLIVDPGHIEAISHMGIILLMFLLGLHLHPKNLLKQLKHTALVTLLVITLTSTGILALLYGVFRLPFIEALVAGIALSFSSTVISLKLIPTTTLHHRRTGEVLISILLLEDILAILTILLLYSKEPGLSLDIWLLPFKTLLFAAVVWLIVRYVVLPVMAKFDVIPEYIFLVSLGGCFSAAAGADMLGLSHEIGAFIAGVAVATSPISLVIAEGLKPLREFFLILFFFSIGAQFDLLVTARFWPEVLLCALIVLILKPLLFRFLLQGISGEPKGNAAEMGLRLGQSSEFALLLAYGALSAEKIANETALLIESIAIVTFIISTYIVVWRLPTPISPSSDLRSD